MESPSGTKILLVYGILFIIIATIGWFPRSWWSRTLRSRQGPGLEAHLMTRREAWSASGGFLLIGAIALAISLGCVWVGDLLFGQFDRSQSLSALMFMAFIGAMMGVGGAVYMGFRALFRPVMMYRWQEDELSRAEFLKRYVSPDEQQAALIFQHPSAEFEVLAVEPAPIGAKLGVTPRMILGMRNGRAGQYVLRSLGRFSGLEAAETCARTNTNNQTSKEG